MAFQIKRASQIRKYPHFVRTRLDKLEFTKNVLERQCATLKLNEASPRVLLAAHNEFYAAYVRFANLAARYCEQGLL